MQEKDKKEWDWYSLFYNMSALVELFCVEVSS